MGDGNTSKYPPIFPKLMEKDWCHLRDDSYNPLSIFAIGYPISCIAKLPVHVIESNSLKLGS